jgi:peroxiredoxin
MQTGRLYMQNKNICLKAGEKAPNFTVKDHMDTTFTLADNKGKRVLLSFHPLAWTSVCAQQMQSLENAYTKLQELNTIAVGVSIDSIPSKKAWAKSLGITKTRLLADFWPHGKVAQLFGIFRERDGFSERANIIVNEDGLIDFIQVYELGELPDIQELLMVLQTEIE